MLRNPLSLLVCLLVAACPLPSPAAAVPANHTRSAVRQATTPEKRRRPESRPARAASTADAKVFMGSIGGKYKIQMRLRREGERLEGAYFYENMKTDIPLTGTMSGLGSFTLSEGGDGGAVSGLFKGQWAAAGAPGEMIELTGNWSSPDGRRVMPFALTEIPVAFRGALRIVTREIKEENKRRGYTIEAEYPQLEGAGGAGVEKFNAEARAYAAREVDKFRRDIAGRDDGALRRSGMGDDLAVDYSLGLATDDLVSVQFRLGSYYAGTAHPNHHTAVINFDLQRGRTLMLADLFKPSAAYLRALSDYCIKELERRGKSDGSDSMLTDEWVAEGAAPAPENYQSWLITREGLEITFDPYRVAPYAAGPQTILIPYAELKKILRTDGPLASVVR